MTAATTTTLAAFLEARLDEDEAAARAAVDPKRPGTHWQWVRATDDVVVGDPADDDLTDEHEYSLRTVEHFPTTSGFGNLPAFVIHGEFVSESLGHVHIARHDPARVLAEVAAKRAILAHYELQDPGSYTHGYAGRKSDITFGQSVGLEWALKALAAPYRSHPDFDPAWEVA